MDKIYELLDPRNNQIRYVGYTNRKDIKRRLGKHVWDSGQLKESYTHKEKWIRELLRLNLKPIIQIILIIPKGQSWKYWERFYIKKYRLLGYNLTNYTDGGDGQRGLKHTEETKRKIRESCKGMNKGVVFTKEHCENISKAQRGKKLTPLHKLRLAIAGKGRIQTKETREKISTYNKNNPRKNIRPIIMINPVSKLQRQFKGINESVRILNLEGIKISRTQISAIINKRKRKNGKLFYPETLKGYIWQYANDRRQIV